MDFCLKKARFASFDSCFQKEIFQISKKVQEIVYIKPQFIEELQDFIKEGDEELTPDKIQKFEKILNNNMESFLICHQLFRRFGAEFHFLGTNTLKFAVIFERNKTESFLKDVEKHKLLTSRISVLSKTYV